MGESATALGRIAYKTNRNIAVCNDALCTTRRIQNTRLGGSTIKIIPFSDNIYVCTKILSKACITYRTLVQVEVVNFK